jgi:O-antigen/teichoic acid export membrane protein
MIKASLKQVSSRMMIMLFNQLAVIITIPWLAMQLSPVVFGFVSTTLIIIQVGWVFIDWGLMNYATEVWQDSTDKNTKNKLITNLIASRLLLSGFYLTLICCLIAFRVIFIPYSYLAPLALTTIFGAVFPLWFFHVNKNPKDLVGITLFSRIAFIFLVMIFVKTDAHALTYLYLHALSFMAITLFAYFKMIVKHSFTWQSFNFSQSMNHIAKSMGFFLNSLTNSNVHAIWSFAVTITQEPIVIGLYNIAEQGYRAGSAISNSVSQVARLNTIRLGISQALRLTLFYTIAYAFVAIMGYFLAEPMIKIFFRQEFFASVSVLKILVGVWLIQSYIKLINYPLLGRLISVDGLHKITPYILFLHLFMMVLWFSFFNDLHSLALTFLAASLIHLSLFAIIIKKNYQQSKSIS